MTMQIAREVRFLGEAKVADELVARRPIVA